MNTQPVVRAIDIGYGNTKFVTDTDGSDILCDLLPSRAPLQQRSAMGEDGLVSGRRNALIPVGDRWFEVGPDTELFKGPPILHEDYTETPEYLALYRACLSRMNAASIDALVTGLPVTHLHQKKDALACRLMGEHPIGDGRSIAVKSVHIFAQPLGGLVDHCITRHGSLIHQSDDVVHLIVDAGFYTFDWVVAKGLKELPGLSGSYDTGVSQLLRFIAQRIGEDTGRPYQNLLKLDRGLRNGAIEIRGKTVDLTPYLHETDVVWSNALTELKNSVGDGGEFDRISLVGGGARLIQAHIQQIYPDHSVQAVTDSVFANVRGFQAIGKAYVRRMTAT